jgi:type I restriction enzyme M protein
MELNELVKKTLALFDVGDVDNLGEALMICVKDRDAARMDAFVAMIDGGLSVDWLQMIYQYYQADRQEKKQDYTPRSLAVFLSRLIGESAETVDMCAGSGALTIQRWIENPDTRFELYEIDGNVIPYLLFNLCLRNIAATVYQGDVLQGETVQRWTIEKGERYGKVSCIEPAV